MMVAALQIIRHGKTISVCHFPALAAPRGGPRFFALIVEIILVRKSRKTPRSRPPLAGRGLFLSPWRLLFILASVAAVMRANTHNDTSFCGDSCSSCYSSFIGTNITDTGYKSGGNDFGQECWWHEDNVCFHKMLAPPWCYLRNLFLCLNLNCTIAARSPHDRCLPRYFDDQASLSRQWNNRVRSRHQTRIRWHQTSKPDNLVTFIFGPAVRLSCCRLVFSFPPRVWASCNYIGPADRREPTPT